VTMPDAVVIRAEEGRRVERVDISPILPPDPGAKAGAPVSTSYASPSVSMAANIMEALEIGTSLLLFDDESTAIPVYSRDAVSRELIPAEASPRTLPDILPLLRDQHGISSVAVGSSEELFGVADRIILFDRFRPGEVTAKVHEMIKKTGCARLPKTSGAFPLPKRRTPLSRNLEPLKHERKTIMPTGRDIVQYGDEYLDLSGLSQLVSKAQVRAIGRAITLVDKLLDASPSLADAIGGVMARISHVGLDTLSNKQMGDLALFRAHELAGAINRMKQLKIK
jgi:predicted ABC-class ATPase